MHDDGEGEEQRGRSESEQGWFLVEGAGWMGGPSVYPSIRPSVYFPPGSQFVSSQASVRWSVTAAEPRVPSAVIR